MRKFSIRTVNPVLMRVAGRLPGFGVLTYRGRKTGRAYRLPINVFRSGDRYLFVLTYGSDVQWVKNVVSAGGCVLRTRGRDVRLVDPELIVDPGLREVPAPVRLVGPLTGADTVLRMRAG